MGPGYLILEDFEIPTEELQKLAYEERTTTLQREFFPASFHLSERCLQEPLFRHTE